MVRVPRKKAEEYITRQLNLFAWLDAQNEMDDRDLSNNQVYQFNLNFFPMVSKDYQIPANENENEDINLMDSNPMLEQSAAPIENLQ